MTDDMLQAFRDMNVVVKAPEARPHPDDRWPMLNKPLISVRELVASGLIPLNKNSLYDALKKGDIPSVRIGGKVLIKTAELRRIIGM